MKYLVLVLALFVGCSVFTDPTVPKVECSCGGVCECVDCQCENCECEQ